MDGCSVPRDITKRQATKLDKKVFHKQKLFIQTMQRSPELGRHVRELHWTVLDASDQFWGALENEEQGPSYVLGENDTWKMHGDTERQSFSQDKPPKVVYAPEDGRWSLSLCKDAALLTIP